MASIGLDYFSFNKLSEKSIFKTYDAEIQTHLRKGQYFVIRTYDITNVQY